MKQVTRCANCNQIFRKSILYRVMLEGYKATPYPTEQPQTIKEATYLCNKCAKLAGYKGRKDDA